MPVKPAALNPLAAVDGAPAFDEPWQAEALAMADSLVKKGLFSASLWSDTLGQELTDATNRGDDDNQQNYYICVLQALEKLVANNSEIDREAMDGKREDWEKAYLSTPHGKPVFLQK